MSAIDTVQRDQDAIRGEWASRLGLPAIQLLLLLHEENPEVQASGRLLFTFVSHHHGEAGSGHIYVEQLIHCLDGHAIVSVDGNGTVKLTPGGHAFADWLLAHDYKVDFFTCGLGEWGCELIDPLGLRNVLRAS